MSSVQATHSSCASQEIWASQGRGGCERSAEENKALCNYGAEKCGHELKQMMSDLCAAYGIKGEMKEKLMDLVEDAIEKNTDRSVDPEVAKQAECEHGHEVDEATHGMGTELACETRKGMEEGGGSHEAGGAEKMKELMPWDKKDEEDDDSGVKNSGNKKGASAKSEKGDGANSWFMILAKALAQALGKKAAYLKQKSDELNEASQGQANAEGKGKKATADASAEFTKANTEFQAASQEFSMFNSAVGNVIKTLGESLGQMARKG